MNSSPLEKKAKKPAPLVEGLDYTVEGGLFVFTSHYLAERGYCCGNGCRNCPYDSEGKLRPEARRFSKGSEPCE